MAWIVSITEANFQTGQHKFKATDTNSGEQVLGTINKFPPSFELLPKSFFDALKKCVDDFNFSEPPIQAMPTMDVGCPEPEPEVRWDDETQKVTVTTEAVKKATKWNGRRTTWNPSGRFRYRI